MLSKSIQLGGTFSNVTIIVRMNDSNDDARDYLCFKGHSATRYMNRMIRDDDILDAYLCTTLDSAIVRALREATELD